MVESLPPDPFQALGLTNDASDVQIKKAHRIGVLRTHPDKAGDKANPEEFHRIQSAYELLSDPDRRRKYEDSLKFSRPRRDDFGGSRGGGGGGFGKPSFTRSATTAGHASPSMAHSRENSGDPQRPPKFSSRPSNADSYFQPRFVDPDSFTPQERRPPPPQTGRDDEYAYPSPFNPFPAYESQRTTSRKSDGYERTPPKSSRSKETPRAASRQEKASSSKPTPRERENVKKQRDQAVRRERMGNVAPEFRTDSDSDPAYEDRSRPPPNILPRRAPRPRSPESESDSREEPYGDRHAGRMQDRMNATKDYIFGDRDRPNILPTRHTYRHEAFGSYEDLRPQPEPEARKPSRTAGGFVRRSSYKPVEPEPRSGGRSRASSLADKKSVPSSRGFNDQPSLSHSSSSPANAAKLASMANSRRTRAASDEDEPPPRAGIRRSETMPIRPQPARAGSYRSELRRPPGPPDSYAADPKENDSGYSTSNSPSEEQNEYIPAAAKTTSYSYPTPKKSGDRVPQVSSSERVPRASSYADDVPEFRSTDYRGSSSRYPTNTPVAEVRASTRVRDSPSPHSRDRKPVNFPAPPVSRSASFNPPRDSDREREPSSGSRRPSLSRQGSMSRRESASGTPSLPRTNSGGPALHVNTKNLRGEGSSQLFGEVPMYSSPVDYHANSSGPDSGRDTRRRPSEDLRAPGSSSRTTRKADPKTRDAKKYLDRDRVVVEERAPRGSRMRA